ncbi:MAG TPA: hypothetical protein PLK82_11285, partial [Bacteroidales bacterium]|nr:hypothetical protein [Bacteroidales bacterium]
MVPNLSGPDTVCAGSSGNVYFTDPGMLNYTWTVSSGGTILTGAGSSSISVAWSQPGSALVTVTYTGATTPGTLGVMVNPQTIPTVSLTPSSNPVCAGTTVTLTAAIQNGGAQPGLQWKVNNVSVGSNSPVYSYVPANGDIITCTLFSGDPCSNPSQVVSAPVTMMVDPVVQPSVLITPSSNPVCQGSQVTFGTLVQNGGSNPAFQWKVNGLPAGSGNATFTTIPLNGDQIVCELTSSLACVSANPATSNMISMTVSPVQTVSLSIIPSSNPVCQGSPVTFTASPVNGGTSPQYLWKVNSVTAGSGVTLSYIPANGDTVVCRLSSNASCASGSPAFSSPVIMTVIPVVPVGVTIQPSANPACQGVPVTFTATPVNGGATPVFQWLLNGFQVGTNLSQYTFLPANGDIVSCKMTSSVSCPSSAVVLSNLVTMSVTPAIPVSVSITASANPVCTGSSVTLTASPFNGGNSPVFEWKVNGSPAGSNSPAFTFVPADGDQVVCSMISNAGCTSSAPVLSNTLSMTVSPQVPVSVTIASAVTTVCQNIQVTFTAAAVNGGTSPVYQWKVNGSNTGMNSPVFNYYPVDGDV